MSGDLQARRSATGSNGSVRQLKGGRRRKRVSTPVQYEAVLHSSNDEDSSSSSSSARLKVRTPFLANQIVPLYNVMVVPPLNLKGEKREERARSF